MDTLRRWLLLLRVPLALASVALFFFIYNRFILDANLQSLRISLSVLDAATGVGQAEAALLLVDQTLLAQMGSGETDLAALASMEYARGTLASDQAQRPVDDAQAMLAVLGEDRATARPPLFKSLDAVVSGVQSAWGTASLFPRKLLGPAATPETDPAEMQKAARLEQAGQFLEAAEIYENLLGAYPHYEGRATLKLRLGYAYQQGQDFERAERTYRRVIQETHALQEIQVARLMLARLAEAWKKRAEAGKLEKLLDELGPGPERQKAAFDLGSTLAQIHNMTGAAEAYSQALQAAPEGHLAPAAKFRRAWCLRRAGRAQEALASFRKIIDEQPDSSWGVAARIEVAQLQKSSGNFELAAQSYEAALLASKDPSLTVVLHSQAANTYQFDMKDPEKAAGHFRSLEADFPASALSNLRQAIREIQQEKSAPSSLPLLEAPSAQPASGPATPAGPAPSAPETLSEASFGADAPLVHWLETFLPVFVDVFSERLAKYLRAAGETEMSRRFTEYEFRELVVGQVQRRFPGQVSGVDAKITPEGFVGTAAIKLGLLTFPLKARIGINVVEERPLSVIHEVKVGILPIPQVLLKTLETRVNKGISESRYPLRVKNYELHEGYALISVELAE